MARSLMVIRPCSDLRRVYPHTCVPEVCICILCRYIDICIYISRTDHVVVPRYERPAVTDTHIPTPGR